MINQSKSIVNRTLNIEIEDLENNKISIGEQIKLNKFLMRKFKSNLYLSLIEDGTSCYLSDTITPANSTSIQFTYHPIEHYFLARPFVTVIYGKNSIKIFSPISVKIGRSNVLLILNHYGHNRKIKNLPENIQKIFGVSFLNEEDRKIDMKIEQASESACREPPMQ